MNYEDMSDPEINKAVADALGLKTTSQYDDFIAVRKKGFGQWVEVDYCNNPSDAWPIIFHSQISLTSPNSFGTEEIWDAEYFIPKNTGEVISENNKNPLRAAMIVFLKMKSEKIA